MRKSSIYVAIAIVTTIIFASCASNGLPRYDERPYNKPMTLVKAAGEDYVISDYESFALYSDPLFVDTTDLGTINMQGGFGRLYRTKKATYLSIDYFQPKDKWFYFFNSGDRLIDEATGDEYWIRKAENIPMDTCCFVKGAKNRYIRFVLVFPPLPKKVREVKYFSPSAPSRDTFTGLATREGPFEVEKMRKKRAPGSSIKPRIIE